MQPKRDISFEVARVYMGLKDYRTSIRLFEASTEHCGAHHVTYHNQGICYFYLEDYEILIGLSTFSETIARTFNSDGLFLIIGSCTIIIPEIPCGAKAITNTNIIP